MRVADSGRAMLVPLIFRRANDREKTILQGDQERQLTAQRQLERELHQLQLDESECKTQLRDKDELERRIKEMQTEISAAEVRLKVMTTLNCLLTTTVG